MVMATGEPSGAMDFFVEVVKSINQLETWEQVIGLSLTLLIFLACAILWKVDIENSKQLGFAKVMMLAILALFGALVLGAMAISSRGSQAAKEIQAQLQEAGVANELKQPLSLTETAPAQRGKDAPSVLSTELSDLTNSSLLYSRTGVKGFEETALSVARLAFAEGRLDEAKAILTSSLEMDVSAEKLNDIGFIYYTEAMKTEQPQDRFRGLDQAARYFEQALQLDPSLVASVNNLGLVYMEKRDFQRAIQQFDRALALDPGYTRALNNRGLAFRRWAQATTEEMAKQELFAKAEADFRAALDKDPTIPQIHYNLALLEHINLKQPNVAVEHYRRAVELDPSNITARNNLSMILQEDESPTARGEALRLAQQAVALREGEPCLLDTLARAYLSTEDCDRAREAAERAVALLAQGVPHMRCDEQEIRALPAQIDSRCPR